MGKLACFPTGDTHPDAILDMAKGHLDEVVVIGVDHRGELFMSGSCDKYERLHWILSIGMYRCMISVVDD